MHGLAALRAAKPGRLNVRDKEFPGTSGDEAMATAIHQWFAAQVTDHCSGAMPGMDHSEIHSMHGQ